MTEAVVRVPTFRTTFIGRETETASVSRLLAKTPLLTIVGIGGVGKTRLAVEVARQQALPAQWVDLAALREPTLVVDAVAEALALAPEPAADVLQTVVAALHGRELLLVLDNCEHLIDACRDLADRLLNACPRLRIVATSRQPLEVQGEVVWSLAPLALPTTGSSTLAAISESPAVQLFIERARAADPQLVLTDDIAPSVASVCQQLDGLPLALELAAVKVRTLVVSGLAAHRDDRLHLIGSTGVSRSPRQQTLRAMLDWSFELLNPSERELFARLAVFAGGWTLAACKSVCAGAAVVELLASLVDRSLVVSEPGSDGHMRYRMLETVRQYATERLVESDATKEIRDRHADFYCELAERADRALWGPDQQQVLLTLTTELGNLRAALHWSAERPDSSERGLRLMGALAWYWYRSGHLREGHELATRMLRVYPNASPARAYALYAAASYAYMRGEPSVGEVLLEDALPMAREYQALQSISASRSRLTWQRHRDTPNAPSSSCAMR